MKAVRVVKEGPSTELRVEDTPKPSIGPGQLLIKIRASFVQPADILNSKGGFPKTVSILARQASRQHAANMLMLDLSSHAWQRLRRDSSRGLG